MLGGWSSGWAERHDISQLTSPLPMATSLNSIHRGTHKAMTLSLETSEEMRDRPLLQPVQDFQIGSIYRRQLRDGVSGLGGGSATGRQQRKQHSHRQLRLSSAGALSNGSAAGRDGMNSMR